MHTVSETEAFQLTAQHYCLIVELTVPWEDRLAISHQLKKAKYQDLIDEALVLIPHRSGLPWLPSNISALFLTEG